MKAIGYVFSIIRMALSAIITLIGTTLIFALRMVLGFFSGIAGMLTGAWYFLIMTYFILCVISGELKDSIFYPSFWNYFGLFGWTIILSFLTTICAFAEAICDALQDGLFAIAGLIAGGGIKAPEHYEVDSYQPYNYETLSSPQQSMTIHVVHHNGEDMSILKEKTYNEKQVIEGDFLEKVINKESEV